MKPLRDDMRMLIAGGGTGGHLFPAIAIAEEFLARQSDGEVLFVGTEGGLEARILPSRGCPFRTISVSGIKGKGVWGGIRALKGIPAALFQSRSIISEFRPDLVLGVGGYASGPVVMTARLMGIRTTIAEQNASPGMTNAILGRFADRIFVSFEETKVWFPIRRVVHTGNPVRAAFLAPAEYERDDAAPTILVFGGSQGAASINRFMVEALPHLREMAEQLAIIHQTGAADRENVAAAYRNSGLQAEVHAFIDDMPAACGRAHLVVCRAGATSIAEITALGRAAILIPYPFAAGNHQVHNAEALVKQGAAELLEEKNCSGAVLAGRIRALCRDHEKRATMEAAAKSMGKPEAAREIVDHCRRMIGGVL